MVRRILGILGCALLVGCAQDEGKLENVVGASRVIATVPDFIEEGARTTITPTSKGMSFAWASGDELAVYGASESSITNYLIEESSVSESAGSASFTNSDFGLREGSTYYAVYPGDFNVRNPHVYPVDYLGQNQLTNESTTHLPAVDYLTASGTAVEGNLCAFAFQHVGAIVRVKITVDQSRNLRDLKITSNGAPFVTKGTVDVKSAYATVTPTETSQTISLALGTNGSGITVYSGNYVLTAYLMIPPVDLSGTTLDISVRANGKRFTQTVAGKNFKAGSASALSASFTTITEDNYEYVDMGLPSGTKWAKYNIGATTEEEYGSYFAWGDVETQSDYSWENYLYCNGAQDELTKYNNKKVFGVVDDVLVLEVEDDAAAVNWGDNWRMPTDAQFTELISSSYTTSVWTQVNGVSGRLYTSKINSNTLFFPAAGYYSGMNLKDAGTNCRYWSKNANVTTPYYGKYFYLDSSFNQVSSYYRDLGLTVRPVRAK